MSATTDAALLLVRLVLGAVMVAHGVKHLRNREKTMAWTASIGLSPPALQWFFMSFAEVGIGISLTLGVLTSVGSAGVVALMTVAFWTVHRRAGFWITARPDEGWEYVLVLAAVAASVAVLGPGEWSVDHVIGLADDLDGSVGALIVGGGLLAAAAHLALTYRPPVTTR